MAKPAAAVGVWGKTSVPAGSALMPRTAPNAVRGVCYVLLGLLCVWLGQIGGLHIQMGDPDFEYFYKAGAWLARHGTLDPGYDLVNGRPLHRGTLDWYWPFVPRIMSLFALLPYNAAGFVWLGLNLAAMLAILRMLGRNLTGLPPRDWPVTQLVPLLVLVGYWWWEFRLNQIDAFTLLFIVGSFVCWQAGRAWVGGFWLGLAILLKLTPALLLGWFLLKRQYRTVASAALCVVIWGPAADLIVFGPAQAAAAYRSWTSRAVGEGSQRALILNQREMDWRNQSVAAVLCRWLHPTDCRTRFDNDPRLTTAQPSFRIHRAALPLPQVAAIAGGVSLVILAGLAWLMRRPATHLSTWQLRFEWALAVLGMLLLMPVMRRYHLIWGLPAVSLLGAGMHYAGRRSRWTWLALTFIGIVFAGQVLLLGTPADARSWSPIIPLEAGGTILASVLLLAVPLVLVLIKLARRPDALPPPAFGPPGGAAAAPLCGAPNA